MKLPRKVYVIMIYDQITKCIPEGVYVGSSANVDLRVRQHLHDHYYGTQKPFHDLMRKRFYQVFCVDEIRSGKESHLEYDWIDFFLKKTRLTVFNSRINQLGADWHRLVGKEEFISWSRFITY